MEDKAKITVETKVNSDMDTVWNTWTEPEHIKKWNNASLDWHTPKAENDLRKDGKFNLRMEAKDGSMGFDFEGEFTEINTHTIITYKLEDDREVKVEFKELEDATKVIETFEAEDENSGEQQRQGWLAILTHFKNYVESKST